MMSQNANKTGEQRARAMSYLEKTLTTGEGGRALIVLLVTGVLGFVTVIILTNLLKNAAFGVTDTLLSVIVWLLIIIALYLIRISHLLFVIAGK